MLDPEVTGKDFVAGVAVKKIAVDGGDATVDVRPVGYPAGPSTAS
ncbi:MAG: DUF59 domain-containing protein [Betaproteobacteria bacterium]|nr:DUF59 domain-containing protein [Betaproteobacteria bacterium]